MVNVVFYSVAGFLGLRCVLVTLDRLSSVLAQAHAAAAAVATAPTPPVHDPVPGAGETPADPVSIALDPVPQAEGAPQFSLPPFPPVLDTPGSRLAARMQAVQPTPVRAPNRDVLTVFRIWIMVFGLVGAQMAWVLRPFLGSPHQAFTWFRPRSSNFFEAILYALQHLFK